MTERMKITNRLERIDHHLERQSAADICGQLTAFRLAHAGADRPLAWWSERAFSQNGEDGVVAEIFARLGRKMEVFVEIGAGDGLQNNTIRWLLDGASGTWIETGDRNVRAIRAHHGDAISRGALRVVQEMVTAENVNDLISRPNGDPREIDLLSIDIDGNDYWVWKAIDVIHPKVVVIEFNGRYGSTLSWTIEYNAAHVWPGRVSYFGASLKALEKLGREKGYRLIGVEFMGVNAFFLRDDILDEAAFPGPYTSEALFQPFRRGFGELPSGKAPAFGAYVNP